jgi:cell division protein FtsX
VLAAAACLIAFMVAASPGGSDAMTPATFASAGIDCAPSQSATGQVFLSTKTSDVEVIAARVAIASVPGVTIDQYLDHRGAVTQLACMFPDATDLLHRLRPGAVPVSFMVTADPASTAHLRSIPNVDEVVTPDGWTAWLDQSRGMLGKAFVSVDTHTSPAG